MSESNAVSRNFRSTKLNESLKILIDSGLPIGSILDVGVLHSTQILMDLFPDKKHYLFEPIEDYFPVINKNYQNLDYKIIHAAVSDSNGEVIIHSEMKMGDNKISHSWISETFTESSRKITSITLNSYVEEDDLLGPFLLKIDVDGADIPSAILRGADRMLEKCSVVVIEMTVDRFFERAALLDAAGFDLWDLTALCYYGGCLWQFDAVYINRSYKEKIRGLSPMQSQVFDPGLWQQG